MENLLFCRRDRISSPFCGEKSTFLATRPVLVAFLRWEIYFFVDETESRRHFAMGNPLFCRRDRFSSPFCDGKSTFLSTRPNLVTILRRKIYFFVDETESRHHFAEENLLFCRRDRFSSPFCGGKSTFLSTSLNLVTILRREIYFFVDEPESRHHFAKGNLLFCRRDRFSSPFCEGKSTFLSTSLNLVTILRREIYFFADETESRSQVQYFV
jgi:hypothetical protein